MDIKTSGDYIAVKVPEGAKDFECAYFNVGLKIRYMIENHWEFSETIPKVNVEIIGLISDIIKTEFSKDVNKVLFDFSIPITEFSQWLIIKKTK